MCLERKVAPLVHWLSTTSHHEMHFALLYLGPPNRVLVPLVIPTLLLLFFIYILKTLYQHFTSPIKPNRLDDEPDRWREPGGWLTLAPVSNLRCPRCRLVFADFDDCCALSCSQCPCKFCAWCGKACSADSREHHDHVAQCPERPAENQPLTRFGFRRIGMCVEGTR